ncbi:TlpA family protein disulfide reductase [Gilvibacter sediminis]|uniref:TlpA family protein disulfide reductase n=1 Tax=Gilvibacter sediminis TaxID=379071 RepID=UPI002350F0BD|nr:TlpA disulfide reductase family protein [Gilvibacter sediminis]MDC7996952.1 TlpA disulfide reductase family protein [Gilvibacter sediminis]
MKRLIPVLLLIALYSCDSAKEEPKGFDLTLTISSEQQIDSVWISDIGQTDSHHLPFESTIKHNFKKNINDLYNIGVYINGKRKTQQIWLDGEEVIVKGSVADRFEIDTVINSEMYYSSMAFSEQYKQMKEAQVDSLSFDKFLLQQIESNIEHPFSHIIALNYISRNQNDKVKLKALLPVYEKQPDSIKTHFLSAFSRLESTLNVDEVEIAQYEYTTLEKKISGLNLDPNKTYLLDFWFVACPPCIRDHKQIAQNMEVFENNDITLIGISRDQDHDIWKNYLDKYQYTWPNYREVVDEHAAKLTKDLTIWSFPTYILITEGGKINGRFNSFKDFQATLQP